VDDTRVATAWTTYVEAAHRFDYFVTGGAGAALAFLLQTYDKTGSPNVIWLAPVGWALLLLTMAAGLAHLQCGKRTLQIGAQQMNFSEERF
jgi:hypothetical protein